MVQCPTCFWIAGVVLQTRYWSSGHEVGGKGCQREKSSSENLDNSWMLRMLQQERFSRKDEKGKMRRIVATVILVLMVWFEIIMPYRRDMGKIIWWWHNKRV